MRKQAYRTLSGSTSTVTRRRSSGLAPSAANSASRIGRRCAPLQEQLRAMLPAQAHHRRRCGAEHLKPGPAAQQARERARVGHRPLQRTPPHHGVDHRHGGRIVKLAAVADLRVEERLVGLQARVADAVMLGIEGLDDRLPRPVAAPGAARDLRQELEGTLRGAEVRQGQPDVGGDHAHEGHVREVMALGDHLRPDEDVDVAAGEAVEEGRGGAAAADRVTIETRDRHARVALDHLLLDALGPESDRLEVGSGAVAARPWTADAVVAVVAAHSPCRAVQGERHAAVRALQGPPALPAEERRREPAAIQQQQRLLPAGERLGEGVPQSPAEHDVRPLGRRLRAHVHHSHRRERALVHARRHHDVHVAPGSGVVVGLHRRGGGSEHDERAGLPPPDDRDVPRVGTAGSRPACTTRRAPRRRRSGRAPRGERRRRTGCRRRRPPPRGGCGAIGRAARRSTARCAAPRPARRAPAGRSPPRPASARSRAPTPAPAGRSRRRRGPSADRPRSCRSRSPRAAAPSGIARPRPAAAAPQGPGAGRASARGESPRPPPTHRTRGRRPRSRRRTRVPRAARPA